MTHSADVICMEGLQCCGKSRKIVALIVRMGIQTHNDISFGHVDANVHSIRHYALGVVNQVNIRILLSIAVDYATGGVAAESVHE